VECSDVVVTALAADVDRRAATLVVAGELGLSETHAEATLEALPFVLARSVDAERAESLASAARAVGLVIERRPRRPTLAGWASSELEGLTKRSAPGVPRPPGVAPGASDEAAPSALRSRPGAPAVAHPMSSRPPAPLSTPSIATNAASIPPVPYEPTTTPRSQHPTASVEAVSTRPPSPRSQPPSGLSAASGLSPLGELSLDDHGPPLELDLPPPPPPPPPPVSAAHSQEATARRFERPRAPESQPPDRSPAPADAADATATIDPDAPFPEQLAAALRIPFGSAGVAWFLQFVGVSLGAAVVAFGLTLVAACLPYGVLLFVGVSVAMGALAQAMLVRWFRATMSTTYDDARLSGPGTPLDRDAMILGLTLYLVVVVANGLGVLAWALPRELTTEPSVLILQLQSLVRILAPLQVALALHQPLGLAFVVARGQKRALFDFFSFLRLFGEAPLRLSAIYGVYAVGIAVVYALMWLMGSTGSAALALAGAVIGALGAFLLYGALGAMLGLLLRQHPDVV
jgi:hypothetical protein